MEFLIFVVLIGLIPAMIARSKGRQFVVWWLYGSLLFIVALPHALLLKPEIKQLEQQQAAQGMKKCPFCADQAGCQSVPVLQPRPPRGGGGAARVACHRAPRRVGQLDGRRGRQPGERAAAA